MSEPTQRRITRNAIQCNRCGDVIESKHRHDWVRCSCGDTFVDGGLEYLRFGFGQYGYTDLTEYSQPESAA